MTQYPLVLANGSTVVTTALPADKELPYHQLGLDFVVEPSAGTLTVEYQAVGDSSWVTITEAVAIKLLNTSVVQFYALAGAYRFTLAGVSGGSGMVVSISNLSDWPGEGLPSGIFTGTRAITSQNYTEANIKNGVQFEASALNTGIAAAGTVDVVFITGAKPIIVKARQLTFNGTSGTARVFRAPTYTGGTNATIYNLNDRNPVASTVTIKSGATVTATGTEFGAVTYLMGSTGNGQTVVSTFAVAGQERILRPNTTYLLRITNTSGSTQDFASYLSWYEGGTNLPRNN